MNWKWLLLAALGGLLIYGFIERRLVSMQIYTWNAEGVPPPRREPIDEGPGV